MIDRNWFEQVICMTEAKVPSDMIDHLCRELGDEAELLPYILLNSEAFSAWPETLETLRQAIRGVIRPRVLPIRKGHEATDVEREHLRNSLFSLFEASENDSEHKPSTWAAVSVIGKFRSCQSGAKKDPRWFID